MKTVKSNGRKIVILNPYNMKEQRIMKLGRRRRFLVSINDGTFNNDNLIFKPDKKQLNLAKKRRLERWENLSKEEYTKEQKLERIKLDIEIFNDMRILRERAMKCQEIKCIIR